MPDTLHNIPVWLSTDLPDQMADSLQTPTQDISRLVSGTHAAHELVLEYDAEKIESSLHSLRQNKDGECLLVTAKGHEVYVVRNIHRYEELHHELGRLREVEFAKVGEGTGGAIDVDGYDAHYHHLIVWDPDKKAIAGGYRLAVPQYIQERSQEGLYTESLYTYSPEFREKIVGKGIELGRSFTKEEYRKGTEMIDTLFEAIVLFVKNVQKQYPEIQYLFGPVSMSGDMPDDKKDALVWCLQTFFKGENIPQAGLQGKAPYQVSDEVAEKLSQEFTNVLAMSADDPKRMGALFKALLKKIGKEYLPFLIFAYAGLCKPGHVRYSDFNIDEAFHSVDTMLVLDVAGVTDGAKAKYKV